MMYHKVIVFMVVVYSANAALIVNAYDDGQQSLSSESDCNYRACDQLCRRLGFPGGACVGDRCECDNFKESQEENEVPQDDKAEVYRVILGYVDIPEENEIQEDNPAVTDQVVVDSEEESEKNEIPQGDNDVANQDVLEDQKGLVDNIRSLVKRDSGDCNARNCDFFCFRKRYTGGICVTGECRCYK